MIRSGDLLTFSFKEYEVKCRVEKVADDLKSFTVIEQANTLRIEKPCNISVTRRDGMISGTGIVVSAVKNKPDRFGKKEAGPGNLKYTIKITKPFKKVQQRNAFRFDCHLPATVSEIDNTLTHSCHILDISSGGAKILTNNRFIVNKVINIFFNLGGKEMQMLGIILDVSPVENANYSFSMRVRFTNHTKSDEEEIVKFIFTEYRRRPSSRMAGKKRT